MERSFYINMSQKGDIKFTCAKLVTEGIVDFLKTNKKQVEILKVDWGRLVELDKRELKEAIENGYYLYKRRYTLEKILGIDDRNPYKDINLCKEIRGNDIDGYIQVSSSLIDKSSDKAYCIRDRWIAKSQTKVLEDRLYIRDWVFFKEFY